MITTHGRRPTAGRRSNDRLACSAAAVLAAGALAACSGGGGGDGGSSGGPVAVALPAPVAAPVATSTVDYPRSVVLGSDGGNDVAQDAVYAPASGATLATVAVTNASPLLHVGANAVVAEHVEPTLPGLRVACVSGRGDSTNVVAGINLGVVAESAAVLFDATWSVVDAGAAWTQAVMRGGALLGWENCGAKPEGAPSASSRLTPAADGGYTEDVYDGNPGTTFNVVTRRVAPTTVAAMSGAGSRTTEDPTRPLVLTLRAYRDNAGNTVLVQRGEPVAGAPPSARGFVALYVWAAR